MEILILGILDPCKFSMEIYFANLDGNLVWKITWKFYGIFYPWNFGSLEISMQIYFGNLDGNLDENLV